MFSSSWRQDNPNQPVIPDLDFDIDAVVVITINPSKVLSAFIYISHLVPFFIGDQDSTLILLDQITINIITISGINLATTVNKSIISRLYSLKD